MIKKLVLRILNKCGYGVVKLPPIAQQEKIFDKGRNIIKKISPTFQILNGPFKGMKYPSISITESTLVPKIVGSYESQLHSVVNKIIETDYTDIIDIGCAEGFYAVGFASRMPHTEIHCFDINEKDLEFCKIMANINDVNNLTFNTLCTPEILANFNFKGKGLIFCDCEGCELELFTPEVVRTLHDVDLLIELHDIFNPTISSEITTRFQYTHNIQILNNLNVEASNLDGLEKLSKEERDFAVFEHRGGLYQNIFMEWAFLTAKSSN